MSSLRNEAAAARQLLQELAAAQAEPLDDETVEIALDSETGLKEAISRALMQMRLALSEASACARLAEEITARGERHERRALRIRESIAVAMIFAGTEKLTLPEATLTLSDKKPKVVITDESALTAQYVDTKTVLVPSKAHILAHLLAGLKVEGSTLDNGGQTLTIRTK
jgi:hypothetical protein